MAFSSSLSRERASLTKQARIYSDQHNDQTSRFYEDAKRDGIYAEVEVEEGREGDRRRMNIVEKPQLLNVSIISFLSCIQKILPPHPLFRVKEKNCSCLKLKVIIKPISLYNPKA